MREQRVPGLPPNGPVNAGPPLFPFNSRTMNRRNFVTSLLSTGAVAPLAARRLFASAAETPLARPSADQTAWQDLECGMFVHIAPNTWQDREYDDLSTPPSAIDADFDTDQWADCAVRMGARYLVFVAKHAGGFCMWQTQTTAYSIRSTPWRGGHGDVMAAVAESCRKRGLKLGVYVSPQDRHFGAGVGGRCADASKQAEYNRIYRQQLTEVFSRYGELVEIWFDGSTVAPVGDLLARYQPHAAIFQGPQATIRWVGNEMGYAPYPTWNSIARADARTGVATALHGDPRGTVWMPVEVDVSIRRPHWFWSTTDEKNLLPLDELINIYYRSVGRGAQLLLNIPPNRKGRIADADFARAGAFGDELRRRFGHSVAETAGRGRTVELRLPAPHRIDHVILQEDCRFGERIRSYRLEGRSHGRWISLGEGIAVGHKRLQPVPPSIVDVLRLTVTASAGEPVLRRLAAFDTGTAPPADWMAPSRLWAADEAGRWNHGHFSLDLTKQIKAAAQYRLRFVPQDGNPVRITSVQLMLDGVAQPQLLRRDSSRPDTLLLDITGLGQTIIVAGQIEGAAEGTVLLQTL